MQRSEALVEPRRSSERCVQLHGRSLVQSDATVQYFTCQCTLARIHPSIVAKTLVQRQRSLYTQS